MTRFLLIFLCLCTLLTGCKDKPSMADQRTIAVLIDPGHGGFDGGAVAADGTYEKHINLAVSLALRDLLLVWGVPVTLTRDTDRALNADDASAVHSNKSSDMHARLALYQQAETVISIHQNHFDIPKYAGTQVFYSGNHTDSKVLASLVQSSVQHLLQPDNHREIKKATNGIYLLHNATVPSVLVECGFLSNPEERELLKDTEYQQKMAFAIMLGYWNYKTAK